MSYTLQAIVGSPRALDQAASEHLVLVSLTDSLKMAPLTDEARKRHNIPSWPLTDGDVAALPPALDLLCRRLSRHGLIAYLEAEIFGGSGTQAHALFEDGVALGSPVVGRDAINRALRRFGVVPGGRRDEFDAVGLGRFRDTDDWTSLLGR